MGNPTGNPIPKKSPAFEEEAPERKRRDPGLDDPVTEPGRSPEQDPPIDSPIRRAPEEPGGPDRQPVPNEGPDGPSR